MQAERRAARILCAILAAGAQVANAACLEVELVNPAPGSTISEARPRIEWRAIEGAEHYRLRLESRVPEGKVLSALDTLVTGTSFVPPAVLTDYQAAVKVRVSLPCPDVDDPTVGELQPRFYIDVSPACPAVQDVYWADGGRIAWAPQPRAKRYDVSIISADDGALLAQAQTSAPNVSVAATARPF